MNFSLCFFPGNFKVPHFHMALIVHHYDVTCGFVRLNNLMADTSRTPTSTKGT